MILKSIASLGLITAMNYCSGSLLKGQGSKFILTSITSITPICVSVIDKLINQNLTNNIGLQNALTIIESVPISLINLTLINGENPLSLFDKLVSKDLADKMTYNIKVVVTNNILQSLTLKCIWQDASQEHIEISSEAQHEAIHQDC